MVTLAKNPPDHSDFNSWLTHVAQRNWTSDEIALARRAYEDAFQARPASLNGLIVADLLGDLGMDHESVIAAILHEVVDEGELPLNVVSDRYGPAIASLVDNATQLHRIGELHHQPGQHFEHLEKLRRMILAMAQDLRVVLLMLAIRLCQLRNHKQLLGHRTPPPGSGNSRYLCPTCKSFRNRAAQMGTRRPVITLFRSGDL